MLTLVALLVLTAFSGAVFWAGRRRAGAIARGSSAPINSRPGHHGAYAAVWTAAPAALVLILVGFLGDRVEESLVESRLPAVVRAMEAAERQVFLDDAISLARGQARSETPYAPEVQAALEVAAAEVKALEFRLHLFSLAAAAVLALAGASWGLTRIRAAFRAREGVERWVKGLLLACSVTAVFTTVGIVASLVWESWRFFQAVPLPAFLFGLEWDPQSAMYADQVVSEGAFGAIPLFAGTFLIMLISMTVAAPVGLFAAIYLSEYASARTRSVVKPLLEVLAGVPTVVYGFFAALTVGPLFRAGFNAIGAELVGGPFNDLGLYLGEVQNQMALVAGAVMGVMLIPFVSSLSDDIINAVPQSLRDGSLAMGATRSETVKKVVLPAALPGVMAAMLLAVSRAVGETMIVTMAAGLQANTTLNPLETVTTVTVQIVTLLTGDQEFDSPRTLSAFGLGLTLFVVTLALNVIALRIVQKYREQYD
ncbi:phosphate ABC transporter permease subunit PstC [Phenylobacterium sp.]|jgi:phosphate transport system permease protein|uniref:phosphate ABC transporter permease subunit PstC n=1 Tax=Phenylobacterium sp. TaxID=1871053 RepID=UPI0025FE81D9|nr:phosphate ABC transporter permease subunit PstC [Phenylobacterium sp.]MCA6285856.1 phosphate ABC transporter permease subunit PstC [Phenylobacterium sp.]MCA6288853.1 phosphate ABC transporter permease subunit PstC [Phenylobacterium sp.]MCA6311385.1 phosphate ABC transporter permease subunit PstC [Phenylobacterium sp.]MCA6322470.1 phosphate ABC transporter permease subunit PstC [Phenylobacterium sp.]MCA6337962.1 phosphate ABC transporter permease subunit PstC [Phenylobacterium sp.]